MKDWKVRQEIYHRLNSDHSDDLNRVEIQECPDSQILDYAIEYFTNDKIGWVYPAKSYVVGICYALWLTKDFGGGFYEYLNDPELLYGNDPYFVPYDKDQQTYDNIINSVGLGFDQRVGVIPDIRHYYEEEFMLND